MNKGSQIDFLIPFCVFVCTVPDHRITHIVKDQCFDLIEDVIHGALLVLREEWCQLVLGKAEAADGIEAVMEPLDPGSCQV